MTKFKHVFQLLIFTAIASANMHADDTKNILKDSIPTNWTYNEYFCPESPDTDQWWRTFDDTMLDTLITAGIKNNYNISMAMRRIKMAQCQLNITRSGYYPSLELSAGWTKNRSSGLTTSREGVTTTIDYFSGAITASWEIDVFGKITAATRQNKEQINMSRAEHAGMMLTVASEIASTYFQLRVWQAELAVANEHSTRQQKIVKITEVRHETGLASMLDVTQAREVYFSTRAMIPVLENSIETAIKSLCLLIGEYPSEIADKLKKPRHIPKYTQLVSSSIPAELLRRRPDVVEAEKNVAANAAALGVAKKEFLPTLSINGSIGSAAHSAGDLFKKNSITYSIAPQLTWTIFDGFSRKATVANARENMMVSIDNYNLTVMTAVEEVENSMSAYISTLKHINAIEKILEQSNKSYELSLDLYKSSLSPFNNVVTAQLNVLENMNSLIVAQGQALTSLVNLYKALGGGWQGL